MKLFLLFLTLSLSLFGQAFKWITTGQWTGCGMLQTEELQLVGERWEFSYNSRYRGALMAEFLDEKEQVVLTICRYAKGLQPPYIVSGKITPALKNSHLRIRGNDRGWTASIKQYVDDIAGYQIYKQKKSLKAMTKYGMWLGEAGENKEIAINIPTGPWKLTAKSFDQGRLVVKVYDAAQQLLVDSSILKPGETSSWFQCEGNYVIQISSLSTSWSLCVELQ